MDDGKRKFSMTVGKLNGVEAGDSAGINLEGLAEFLTAESKTLGEFCGEMEEEYSIFGTSRQLSRAMNGDLALTFRAETAIMGKCSFDSLEELLTPAYSKDELEKIRKHRARVKGDGDQRSEMLRKRHEDNLKASG